jgi:GWxTD domain-containing protein
MLPADKRGFMRIRILGPVCVDLRLSAAILLLLVQAAYGQTWFERVAPVMSADERKTYLALRPEAREKFEQAFWDDKAIAADEYFRRLSYVDANFGSGKAGSGVNTDQGRVYLGLGAPNGITRVPSSKYFFPLEIWNYSGVPRLGINSELRLIFYPKNGRGLPKLYSPTLDTIRALLVPQAGLLGMFGPNDEISESDIRGTLNYSPAEEEIVSAAVNVSPGIKGSGNQEVLGRVLSPQTMLRRDLQPLVHSEFSVWRPKMDVLLSPSKYGGVQVDLSFELRARAEVSLEVLQGDTTVWRNVIGLKFENPRAVQLLHRLDLLPGSYRVIVGADRRTYPFALEIPAQARTGEMVRAAETRETEARSTPWEFEGSHLYPSTDGKFAVLALAEPGAVNWMLRRGYELVWKRRVVARETAVLPLETDSLVPGKYELEAEKGGVTKRLEFEIRRDASGSTSPQANATLLSYNANLSPAERNALIGHQWLLRGKTAEAVEALRAALPLRQAQIDLARIDALAGRYDAARAHLQPLLSANANDFDALSVMAYVEAKLQDYQVAADYYRRALAVQDSPTLRTALATLPH